MVHIPKVLRLAVSYMLCYGVQNGMNRDEMKKIERAEERRGGEDSEERGGKSARTKLYQNQNLNRARPRQSMHERRNEIKWSESEGGSKRNRITEHEHEHEHEQNHPSRQSYNDTNTNTTRSGATSSVHDKLWIVSVSKEATEPLHKRSPLCIVGV